MKKLIIFSFLLFGLIAGNAQHSCVIDDPSGEERQSQSRGNCSEINLNVNEIIELPQMTFKVALHFKALPNGDNFTCDQNSPLVTLNPFLYAPTFANSLLSEMNTRMSEALILNGQFVDTKIRFELVNGGDCNSIYTYSSTQNFNDLPNAINLHFVNDTSNPGIRGWTYYGSNKIYAENVLTAFLNGSNNTWDLGRLINHEFGHTRNLKHAFNCSNPCNGIDINVQDECCGQCWPTDSNSNGCWGCSGRSLMMAYGTQLRMTPCELEEMWNYIINNPRPYQSQDLCTPNPSSTPIVYDINALEIWDDNKIFTNDLILKNGTTIDVRCTVSMAGGKKIYVERGAKLIVDGGTITNLCQDYWSGIKVAGGNSDFDVKIYNWSVVENTNEAAVTMWPTTQSDPGNGILHAQNSTFNSVKGIVGFWAPSTQVNSSYVDYCQQYGGVWSISNTNCQRISVTNNRFYNIRNECIYSNNGSFNITDNDFHSDLIDILSTNTFSGFSSTIANNSFNGQNTGYMSTGPSLSQNLILENKFNNPQFNMINDGYNNFRAEGNTFQGNMGVLSFNNGFGIGDVGYNTFLANFIGAMPVGVNSDFNFYENCFSSFFSDVYIDGEVSLTIHNNGEAANNCFTHQGASSSSILDISGNISPFTYLEPADDDVDCRDAVLADPNVTKDYFGNPDLPECSDGFIYAPIPLGNPCSPGESEQEILYAIAWLTNKIEQIQNNENLSQYQKDKLIAIYQKCLRRLQGRLSEMYTENGAYEDAIQVFDGNTSLEANIITFSIYMISNDLISAENFLLSREDQSENWDDFKAIQLINLELLRSNDAYEISKSKLGNIKSLAQKSSPISAYAKSLYYTLTGDLLTSIVPEIANNDIRNRLTQEADAIEVNISPNPFTKEISIEKSIDCEVVIYNSIGQIMYSNASTDKHIKVNSEAWSQGFYIIVLKQNGKVVHQQKLVSIN